MLIFQSHDSIKDQVPVSLSGPAWIDYRTAARLHGNTCFLGDKAIPGIIAWWLDNL